MKREKENKLALKILIIITFCLIITSILALIFEETLYKILFLINIIAFLIAYASKQIHNINIRKESEEIIDNPDSQADTNE